MPIKRWETVKYISRYLKTINHFQIPPPYIQFFLSAFFLVSEVFSCIEIHLNEITINS